MRRLMSIDYGTRHIGIAFTESLFAEPVKSLPNDESLLSQVKDLIDELKPEEIILGLPEGPLEEDVKKFKEKLLGLRIPVTLHPETLSTQEAITKLRESGAKKSKLKNDHSYAAALILEDYLDSYTD